jgi:hypothetical protein
MRGVSNARRFDGRMVFVPEKQHDRSLARSAWVWGLEISGKVALRKLCHFLFEIFIGPCPEGGYRTQPRVSTLGTDQPTRRALKGRQIERPNKVEIGVPMAQL